jgi:cytochrome c peroxidase
MISKKLLAVISTCLLVVSCSNDDTAVNVDEGRLSLNVEEELLSLVTAAGLTGDPTTGRTLPAVTDPKAKLGKKLFFSKGLGGNDDSACVTCHHPSLGGGDDLSLSIGVNATSTDLLGPGRMHDEIKAFNDNNSEWDGGPPVPRNTPTTFNIALWDQAMFHDGRVESLGKTKGANGNDGKGIVTPDSDDFTTADPDAGDTLTAAQSRFPITSPEEMRGFTFQAGNTNAELRTALEEKLRTTGWPKHFEMTYGDDAISHLRIAEAIGEYERSQVFVDSPWKAYVEGDKTAISESAKRGATMFFSSIDNGGANCTSCHAGDFFTDEQFHVLATPQIGRGKGGGDLGDDDFGRSEVSGNLVDKYKFRTPTLLNVEVTGPWGHAGAYTELENMVRHMLNPAEAIANYDMSQLDANAVLQFENLQINTQRALDQLEANRTNNVSGVHQNVEFTDADVTDLVEFLKTLTDPCVKNRACLAPWIPSGMGMGMGMGMGSGPDGLKLDAVDVTGASL